MPHLILEYTPQAKERLAKNGNTDLKVLFHKLHKMLENHGVASVPKCKSRAYLLEDFLLSDDPSIGFVHLEMAFLEPNLSAEKKRELGSAIKAAVMEFFGGTSDKMEFSLEIRILEKELYWRNLDY